MSKVDKKGNWIDATGNSVPKKYVTPLDKRRDAMVERLFREALAAQEKLIKLRRLVDAEVAKYLDSAAAEILNFERNEGGNYTFTGFSGDKKVMVKVVNYIDFDERLQFAKQMIDSCLERWSEGANDNLRAVVFDAFKVDAKGRVDTKRILGLRRLNIKDQEWKQAMDLISQAVTVIAAKEYVIFQRRPDQSADWQTVRLDIAAY